MNVDNNNLSGINQANYTKNKNPEALKDFKKSLVENIYKKARQEVPQDGLGFIDFEPVSVTYKDTETKDIYSFTVQSGHNEEEPEQKVLRAAYQLSDDDSLYYMDIKRGSKQEILDYLGDERNLGKLKGFLSILKERALQGD